MVTLATKCKHCKKAKGNHKAKTLACPTGSKSRIGYTSYSDSQVFEASKASEKTKKTQINNQIKLL